MQSQRRAALSTICVSKDQNLQLTCGHQIRTEEKDRKKERKKEVLADRTFERWLVRREDRKTPLETKALQLAHGRVNGSFAPPSCREGG